MKQLTLCSSMSTFDEYGTILTLQTLFAENDIVCHIPVDGRRHFAPSNFSIQAFKKIHKAKIDLADAVLVIMKLDGTMGDATKDEFEYAIIKNKKIITVRPYDPKQDLELQSWLFDIMRIVRRELIIEEL